MKYLLLTIIFEQFLILYSFRKNFNTENNTNNDSSNEFQCFTSIILHRQTGQHNNRDSRTVITRNITCKSGKLHVLPVYLYSQLTLYFSQSAGTFRAPYIKYARPNGSIRWLEQNKQSALNLNELASSPPPVSRLQILLEYSERHIRS